MTDTWKTVRVFISSTFRDMQAERDHLVRFVFPRLREQLLSRRIHLVAVDLRWGVTGEEDASEVCREVITECRPRFLCMLGGRYGTIPDGKELSITADEVDFGVLGAHRQKIFALFYFRHGAVTERMDESSPGSGREPKNCEKATKLAALKRQIRRLYRPYLYRPRWNPSERRLLELRAFGDRVERDILATIDAEFGAQTRSHLDEFAEANAAMEAFVEERKERFVLGSREPVLEDLLAHASATGGNSYVCLTGEPGSGKSALLAHLSQHPALTSQSSILLIGHFVGTSPGSTDVRRTLQRLCHELKAGCPDIPDDIPDELQKLRVAFGGFLRRACARQRIVMLFDGINQFDPAPHSIGLRWLPEELPANVRVILSTVDGPALEDLRCRRHPPKEFELKPLTATDGEAIIEQFRQRYRKKLAPDQRAALLAKADAGVPLYVLAALEELRTLGTYEITRRIAELPPTTNELFVWILERLGRDHGFRDTSLRLVGRELVSRFSALLAASRYGLSQGELADLLDAGDPQGNVAALLHLLHPYLMNRGELLDFFHGQFRAAAMESSLKTEVQRQGAHARLAGYFCDQADPERNQTWKGENPRPFAELPYHLTHAELSPVLDATLSDPAFCEIRFRTGGPFELRSDCQHALQLKSSFVISAVERAITTGLGALLERPDLCMQTFVNRLAWLAREDPVVKAGVERASRVLDERGCWVQADSPYPRMDSDSPLVPFQIEAVAQCLSVDEQRIVVLGEDRRVRTVDLSHGSLHDHRDFPESTGRVISLQSIDSGDRLAWLDSAGILRLEQSTQSLQVRQGENLISFLAKHGLVAVDTRGDLVAWDPDTGRTRLLAAGLSEPVKILRATRNGFLLCVTGRSPQRVLALATDTRIEVKLDLVWQQEPIVDADFDSAAQAVLLLCRDRTLRRIGVHGGKLLAEPFRYEQGKPAAIWGAPLRCALGSLSTAGWAFLATGDGQIGAWNWESSEFRRMSDWRTDLQRTINLFTCLHKSGHLVVGLQSEARLLTGSGHRIRERFHQAPINACVVTDQGEVVSASEYDGTVCWFSAGPGLNLKVRQNHRGLTAAAAVPGSNDILLGNNSGWCWRQPPDREVSREEIFCLFDRKVAALTSRDDRTMVASDITGCTMLVEKGRDDPLLLRHGSGSVRQAALQRASAPAVCWSLHETAERGDITHRLSLLEGINRETEVLRDNKKIVCISYAPDQDLICLGSYNVRIFKMQGGQKAFPLYQRETAVDFVTFVDGFQRLAVIRRFAEGTPAEQAAGLYEKLNSPWLEVWDAASGLPTVAAVDLPGQVTCFAALGDLMLVGFESGELLRLRLRYPRAS